MPLCVRTWLTYAFCHPAITLTTCMKRGWGGKITLSSNFGEIQCKKSLIYFPEAWNLSGYNVYLWKYKTRLSSTCSVVFRPDWRLPTRAVKHLVRRIHKSPLYTRTLILAGPQVLVQETTMSPESRKNGPLENILFFLNEMLPSKSNLQSFWLNHTYTVPLSEVAECPKPKSLQWCTN